MIRQACRVLHLARAHTALVLAMASLAVTAGAMDWGTLATISSTMGVSDGRLCLGESSRHDIGCPAYAPYVNAGTGNVGIGTSAPSGTLHVYNPNPSSTVSLRVSAGPYNSFGLTQYGNTSLGYIDNAGWIGIRPNGQTVAIFTKEGATIGYGASTPNTALQVLGSIRLASEVNSPTMAVCDANRAGAIKYEAGDFSVCRNGTNWETLSGIADAGSDRITSGTTSLVATGNTGFVSLTQAGTNTGWFDPTRGLVTIGVSSTGPISGTNGYFSGLVAATSFWPTSGNGIKWSADGNDSILGNGSPNNNIRFITSGTEAMRIVSNGFVGIGVTQPSSALHVKATNSSNNVLTLSGSSGASMLTVNSLQGSPYLGLYQASGGMLGVYLDTSSTGPGSYFNSKVGIGTSTPSSTLTINTSNNINAGSNLSNGLGGLLIRDGSTSGLLMDPNQIEQMNAADSLYLNYNSPASTIINAGGGQVGIGTNTPSGTLHVYNPSLSAFYLSAGTTANALKFTKYTTSSGANISNNGWITLLPGGASPSAAFAFTGSGVGMGNQASSAFPSTTLQVLGSVRLGAETSSTQASCDTNRTGAIKYEAGDFSVCRNGTSWETLSGIADAGGDRITSGTTHVVANSASGYVSFTSAGTTTGYYSPAGIFSAVGVSTTGAVSTSGLYVNGNSVLNGNLTALNTGGVSGSLIFRDNTGKLTGTVSLTYRMSTNNDFFLRSQGTFVSLTGINGTTDGLSLLTDGSNSYVNAIGNDLVLQTARNGVTLDNIVFQSLNTATGAVKEYMRITSNSLVGIGTAVPTTPLEVSGTVSATRFTGDGSGLTGVVATSLTLTPVTNGSVAYISGSRVLTNNNLVWDSPIGQLRIGGPQSTSISLSVVGTALISGSLILSNSGYGNSIVIRDNTNGMTGLALSESSSNQAQLTSYNGNLTIRTVTPSDVIIQASSTEIIRAKASNGFVGINRSNPNAQLDVSGTISATAATFANATTSNTLRVRGSSVSYAAAQLLLEATGLGSPNYRATGMQMYDTAGDVSWFVGRPYAHSDMLIFARLASPFVSTTADVAQSAYALMTLDKNGRLGIGVTPTTALEVSGTVSATAYVGDGSGLTGVTAASGDRITSGTASVIAQTSGLISITTGGVDTGYFNSNGVLTLPGISATQNLTSVTTLFAGGNVGIGTAPSPTFALDIFGANDSNGSTMGVLRIAANTHKLVMDGNEIDSNGILNINYNSGKNVLVGNGGSGWLGVGFDGSTNTTLSATLHVSGSLAVVNAAGIDNPVLYTNANNGFVGIGTLNPARPLEISGTAFAPLRLTRSGVPGSIGSFDFAIGSNLANGITGSALQIRPVTTGDVVIMGSDTTIGAPSFIVRTSGSRDVYVPFGKLSVGVSGTTTASATLHVSGTALVTGGLTVSGNGASLTLGDGSNSATAINIANTRASVGWNSAGAYLSAGSTYGINFMLQGGVQTAMSIVSSGSVGIGTNAPAYTLHVSGSVAGIGAYNALSDRRFKKNISPATYGLSVVGKLRPVTFDWMSPPDAQLRGRQLGLIAQEVQPLVPEAVTVANDPSHTLSIAYGTLVPVLIKSVQELKADNDNLRSDGEKLRNDSAALRARLDAQQAQIDALKASLSRQEKRKESSAR